MPKIEPFFKECSGENCASVRSRAYKDYDRKAQKKRPSMRRKGGLAVRVLEPAQIPILGEQPKTYTVSRHGLGIEFRRCYEFDYIDKHSHRHETATCTEKRVVNIPQRTLNCYKDVEELLTQLKKGKRGKPTIAPKILAAVACSRSGVSPTRVSEPISPSTIAVITMEKLSAVRKSLEPLVATGRVKCVGKYLPVLEEKQCTMSPTYLKAFEDFVKTEKEERKWIGFRRLFGDYIQVSPKELPEAKDMLSQFKIMAPEKGKMLRKHRPTTKTFITSSGKMFEL